MDLNRDRMSVSEVDELISELYCIDDYTIQKCQNSCMNICDFLLKNGFDKLCNCTYTNDRCKITICENFYVVFDIEFKTYAYSDNLNIYWLIGYLTYYGYINKDYDK